MKRIFTFIFAFSVVQIFLNAQQAKVLSGPMNGYAEHRECLIWIETKCASEIKIVYKIEGDESSKNFYIHRIKNGDACNSEISKIILSNLMPGKTFLYRLYLDNKEVKFAFPLKFKTRDLWEYRTPAPNFSFITGSCAYINDSIFDRPGEPYGLSTKIFTSMAENPSSMMLWLGDNTYLREADYSSETGIIYRYRHTRRQKDIQKLLSTKMNYAIWDDHDYGTNNSCKTFELKNYTRETFINFWGNKSFGDRGEGTYSKMTWSDCDFFLLDNRWFRDEELLPDSMFIKSQLGKKQLEWFKQSLIASRATFKFIVMGGQFLNINTDQESYAQYLNERNDILNFIQKCNIKGVFFISGDRHHTEIIKQERFDSIAIKNVVKEKIQPKEKEKKKKKEKQKTLTEKEVEEVETEDSLIIKQPYPLYELTCSPLTSHASNVLKTPEAKNPMRVPQTLVTEQNYCQLSISGSKGNRNLLIKCFDKDNNLKWEFTVSQKDLE